MAVQMTRQKVSSLMERLQGVVDRIVPPETRQQLLNSCNTFTNEQPLLATFLAIQIALSIIPLLLFITFTLVTLLLVIVAAIGISVFWIGAALLILIPTLFAALSFGLLVWIWVVGTYLFGRFIYRKSARRSGEHQPISKKSDWRSVTGVGGSINEVIGGGGMKKPTDSSKQTNGKTWLSGNQHQNKSEDTWPNSFTKPIDRGDFNTEETSDKMLNMTLAAMARGTEEMTNVPPVKAVSEWAKTRWNEENAKPEPNSNSNSKAMEEEKLRPEIKKEDDDQPHMSNDPIQKYLNGDDVEEDEEDGDGDEGDGYASPQQETPPSSGKALDS
ncbi:MAG: hypothetical protein M1823_001465 [Watsoniomyces obsoletus]|nr:MAG: hypothetical protein M1823_001465 [Watsoniomyces obsoletus]